MFYIILAVIISFLITYFAIPVIIQVAEKKMLFDVPDARKIHITPIPSLGGLGIFAGFVIACLVAIPFFSDKDIDAFSEFQYFIAATLVIFFLGLKDDILNISPLKKFIGQVLAAFLIIFLGDLRIESMHGFLGIERMLSEPVSLILTYFTVLVIINSFNLIDGVDGLAGSLGLLTTVVLGSYFFSIASFSYATLSFALAGSLGAFLIFNFHPAKIFMGDTGSLLIGLVSSILIIKFINVAPGFDLKPSPAIAFSIIMVPLMDTLRVFSIRILHRRSPFSPDRNHVHHLLLDRGFTHRQVTLTLVGINMIFIALAYFCRSIGCTLLILAISSLFFAITGYLYYSRRKPVKYPEKPANDKKEPLKGIYKILFKDGVFEEK
ncbi:MAG: MraY family glycosyltransferase [Chitinophagaceae bacterium]